MTTADDLDQENKDALRCRIKEEKQSLRDKVDARVASITDTDKLRQSHYVYLKIIANLDYRKCKSVAIYLHTKDEIHTHNLVKHIFDNGKRCYIPRYNCKQRCMDMLELRDNQDLVDMPKTRWNIKQPKLKDNSRANALEEGVDMILMPGCAFSDRLQRLGRGGGFYDRYLTAYKQRHGSLPHLFALSFRQQICPSIPMESTDVLVHRIVYEPADRDELSKNTVLSEF